MSNCDLNKCDLGECDLFKSLKHLLCDYATFYFKLQSYHWNFEGPDFFTWHQQFQEQYENIAEAIDVLAELIRGLGKKAPGDFETYLKHTSLKSGDISFSGKQMIEDIIHDHQVVLKTLQCAIDASQKAADEVVTDFVIERMTYHRKVLWLLNSSK